MMIKKLLLSFLILFFTLEISFGASISGKVLSIHDGDTINFLPVGAPKKARLRLLGVDTPEIDFNGHSQGLVAEKARDHLRSLLPIDSVIKVELHDEGMDSNGRYLGQIIYQGIDINFEMLKAGWGATYFIFPYNKEIVKKYSEASRIASEKSLGLFSNEFRHEELPYVFRQSTKGIPGTNFVADFQAKKIVNPEQIETILHYNRVFFSSEEIARQHGFSW